jgi:hypothetical protein
MPRHVDNGVERRAGRRHETVRFVTVDTDEARAGRNRTGDAARRTGHVVAVRHGMRRNRTPEKLRAAEDQQAHTFPPGLICQSNVIKVIGAAAMTAQPKRVQRVQFSSSSNKARPSNRSTRDASLVFATRIVIANTAPRS